MVFDRSGTLKLSSANRMHSGFCAQHPLSRAGLRSHQRIAIFSKQQYLPDANLNRGRGGDDLRSLAGFALDRVDRIQAHVETHALRNKAFNLFAIAIAGA
jgi:hypothetical protein